MKLLLLLTALASILFAQQQPLSFEIASIKPVSGDTFLLAENLSTLDPLGRPVVDQTGLTGNFDFSLDWFPDSFNAESQGPDFLAAIREQLGLKLESTRAPVRTLVVDHVERPTEN